jgi:hypothetical protein
MWLTAEQLEITISSFSAVRRDHRSWSRLREILAAHKELAHKLAELEQKYAKFKIVFDTIRELMAPPEGKRKQIGFDD